MVGGDMTVLLSGAASGCALPATPLASVGEADGATDDSDIVSVAAAAAACTSWQATTTGLRGAPRTPTNTDASTSRDTSGFIADRGTADSGGEEGGRGGATTSICLSSSLLCLRDVPRALLPPPRPPLPVRGSAAVAFNVVVSCRVRGLLLRHDIALGAGRPTARAVSCCGGGRLPRSCHNAPDVRNRAVLLLVVSLPLMCSIGGGSRISAAPGGAGPTLNRPDVPGDPVSTADVRARSPSNTAADGVAPPLSSEEET